MDDPQAGGINTRSERFLRRSERGGVMRGQLASGARAQIMSWLPIGGWVWPSRKNWFIQGTLDCMRHKTVLSDTTSIPQRLLVFSASE